MSVYGVDVSDWQGYISWHTVLTGNSPKISFCYAKATDGTSGTQDTFNHNHDACSELDIEFGAYHFYEFSEDPVAQANHFIASTIGAGRGGHLIPMVDVEVGAANAADLSKFCKAVEAAYKIPHMLIYTDAGYWDGSGLADGFSGHPVWVANFVHEGNMPKGAPYMPQTGGWKDWTIWQYDNEGSIPGIGNVDLDECRDLDAIRRPGL